MMEEAPARGCTCFEERLCIVHLVLVHFRGHLYESLIPGAGRALSNHTSEAGLALRLNGEEASGVGRGSRAVSE